MPDTPTPNIGLKRPRLGSKPWKSDVDFNWGKIDSEIGGLKTGTVTAGVARNIEGAALTPFIDELTGTLSGTTIAGQSNVTISVDHSSVLIFDLPAVPIFAPPAGVQCLPVQTRLSSLNNVEYGGKFAVRVENSGISSVNGVNITWRRKGIKVS